MWLLLLSVVVVVAAAVADILLLLLLLLLSIVRQSKYNTFPASFISNIDVYYVCLHTFVHVFVADKSNLLF